MPLNTNDMRTLAGQNSDILSSTLRQAADELGDTRNERNMLRARVRELEALVARSRGDAR